MALARRRPLRQILPPLLLPPLLLLLAGGRPHLPSCRRRRRGRGPGRRGGCGLDAPQQAGEALEGHAEVYGPYGPGRQSRKVAAQAAHQLADLPGTHRVQGFRGSRLWTFRGFQGSRVPGWWGGRRELPRTGSPTVAAGGNRAQTGLGGSGWWEARGGWRVHVGHGRLAEGPGGGGGGQPPGGGPTSKAGHAVCRMRPRPPQTHIHCRRQAGPMHSGSVWCMGMHAQAGPHMPGPRGTCCMPHARLAEGGIVCIGCHANRRL